mgnify:CR=1 FL=1
MIRISGFKINVTKIVENMSAAVEKYLKLPAGTILSCNIVKESIDAREKPNIYKVYTLDISSDLEGLCDDIYMIHNGKIVLHEDTDKLLGEYALMKVNENQFGSLDKQYILSSKKENFGYSCFTNQKQYYKENYPDVVIENGNIDDLIIMMSEEK